MRRLLAVFFICAALLYACGKNEYEKARDFYSGSRTTMPSEQAGFSEPLGQATALLENFLSHNHEDPAGMLLLWRCYLRTGNPRALAMHESMIRNAESMREILFDEIGEEEDPYMRVRMVNLFGEIATEGDVENFIDILNDDAHPTVQEAAAAVLARLKNDRAVEPLLDKLHDRDANVRAFVCSALAAFPQPRVLETLLATLVNNEEAGEVRANAALALAEMARLQADLHATLLEKLRLSFEAPNASLTTQILAALVFAKLGVDSGKQLAMDQAFATDGFVRGIAITILGEVGTGEAVPLIAPAMTSDNAKLRLQTAEALGKLGDAKGLPSLYQAVNDPVEVVREAAQNSIERIRRKTSPR